tara:strand:- start:574 stop:795 length:222 start_codon:yes stop_codon:yes gene_type:complete
MIDIVERLRTIARRQNKAVLGAFDPLSSAAIEAANEIERLRRIEKAARDWNETASAATEDILIDILEAVDGET